MLQEVERIMILYFVLVSFFAGCNAVSLERTLDALARGLQFMEDKVSDINLDGVFGTRLVEEQLTAYLTLEPDVMEKIRGKVEVLRDQARRVSDEGMKQVQRNDPAYSASVGHLLSKSKKLMWYPSRSTDQQMMQQPVPCALSVFNETVSDGCLEEIVGKGNQTNTCIISRRCEEMMSTPRQQGYMLTHQMLYWQLLEMRKCIHETTEYRRVMLCSNVMRDTQRIAAADYPRNHQDLFMEQIGLCGMWGFKDFYRPEWLHKILEWQEPSGCYNKRAKWHCEDHIKPENRLRTKRREKIMAGGCLSHKTTVAILAIAVNLRFMSEELYKELHF